MCRGQAHIGDARAGLCLGGQAGQTGELSVHSGNVVLRVWLMANPGVSLSLRRAFSRCQDGGLLSRAGPGDAGGRCPDASVGTAPGPASAGNGRGRQAHLQ